MLRFVAVTDRTIPQRELRNNVSAILREVELGGSFTVTVRDRPVARLIPSQREPRVDVNREVLRKILAGPLDGDAMLADLDWAEAPVDSDENR